VLKKSLGKALASEIIWGVFLRLLLIESKLLLALLKSLGYLVLLELITGLSIYLSRSETIFWLA